MRRSRGCRTVDERADGPALSWMPSGATAKRLG